jgi:nitrite reductase (NADH) large subunit
MDAQPRLVVIGNGMVGQRFLEALDPAAGYAITVLAEEPRTAYDRVQLSTLFSGRSALDLSLAPAGFFESAHIALRLGERATAIDRRARRVHTHQNCEYAYDKLVLATGSSPFVPPIPGCDRAGCHVYRTIEDLDAIRASACGAASGVVIGGGLLGLEAAKALTDLGLATHVVEFAPRLMALQVDDGGGAMLRRRIAALGVSVHTGKDTRAIRAGVRARHALEFGDSETLEADVVVFSAGIRPRDELARAAGLEIGARGGVLIDDACRSSDPDIHAIGECALWGGRIFGLVSPGYRMAEVAAAQLSGTTGARFTGADLSTKLRPLPRGRRCRGERLPGAHRRGRDLGAAYQPHCCPRFCSSSHCISGWKYSMIAPASMSREPVSFSSASCQGSEAPRLSIAAKRRPASRLP